MKLLITGGSGFIGSALVRLALRRGHEVVNLDALTYAASPHSLDDLATSAEYAFEHADIRDSAALERIFEGHRPDAVLHLAAETHVDRSIDAAGIFVQTNIVGSYKLLEAARSYWQARGRPSGFRFVHVSTDEVFGSLGAKGKFTEQSRYDPRSPYAASKAASDHLVRAWGETYGLPVILTNCSNNYGPYQMPEKLVPQVILNGLRGAPIRVYGDGNNIRDWVHVEDHADALLRVLELGRVGGRYNIGANNEVRNLDLVRQICQQLDAQLPAAAPHDRLITFVADRPGHDRRYAIDASRLRDELGWRPAHLLQSGLAQTVSWYLANEAWWRPILLRDGMSLRLGAP